MLKPPAGKNKSLLYIRGQKTTLPLTGWIERGRSVFRFEKPQALARGAQFVIWILLFVITLSGCAVTGPYVSEEEIKQAGAELKVKALKFQIDYLVKVNNIGYKLLLKLPEEDSKGNFVYSGLLL